MPSIIPEFEYDIFISYRQNDNKKDGWVTEFVRTLQDELDATVKEKVSIYFDENPHDGLHEHHEVDDSLKEKLNCLILIPIVSQTYCDPNSFAWEHEFKVFINQASEDKFGLKTKLSTGNVSSRILPVKIHDLDPADQQLFESEIGGVMRSIDFIFKDTGVNRPLSLEDNKNENLNNTRYKDQVNKVANAIKDILSALKGGESLQEPTAPIPQSPGIGKPGINKKVLLGGLVTVTIVMAYFIYSLIESKESYTGSTERSIAVLAFNDQSPDGDQEWLGDGVAEEILNVLAKVKGLKVSGKSSSFSFKGKDATINEIGDVLEVKSVLEGSVSKVGNRIRITAQLIDVESDRQIWSDKYDRDAADIFAIMDDVSQNIANALMGELSLKELGSISSKHQVNEEAFEYYLKGIHFHWNNYVGLRRFQDFDQSEQMFVKAISIDPSYGESYAGLADLYDSRAEYDENVDLRKIYRIKRDSVINIGYRINPRSPYVLVMKGLLFRQPYNLNLDSAFHYFRKAYELDSSHFLVNLTIGVTYRRIGLADQSIHFMRKLVGDDPLNKQVRSILVNCLMTGGYYDEAAEQVKNILEFDSNYRSAIFGDLALAFQNGDTIKIKEIYNIQSSINPIISQVARAWLLASRGRKEEAISIIKDYRIYSILNMKEEAFKEIEKDENRNGYLGDLSYLNLKNNKVFDNLRQEDEFINIFNKAKIVHEERMQKYGHLFND